MHDLAKKIGHVLEVQVDPKGNGKYKGGRVKVDLGLIVPLKLGAILDIGTKWLWVEFKYEHLPHYYYSCGRIGHYATNCELIPYNQSPWAVNKIGKFGP